MILGWDLPKYLWAEAVNYTVWLKNYTPSRAVPGHIPFELIYKAKPDLSNTYKFDAKMYVHQAELGKLEARAEKAIFIGIDRESKEYHIYWPGKCEILVKRNISFMSFTMDIAADVAAKGESNPTLTVSGQATPATAKAPTTPQRTHNLLPEPPAAP